MAVKLKLLFTVIIQLRRKLGTVKHNFKLASLPRNLRMKTVQSKILFISLSKAAQMSVYQVR